MRTSPHQIITFCFAVFFLSFYSSSPTQAKNLDPVLLLALGPDPEEAASATREIRSQGMAGVQALLAAAPRAGTAQRQRWEQVLDTVCAQRDCAASGLYWHTDFDAALVEAQRTERPILSLRLLGRLDEEVSCANSRFFRSILYPDPNISEVLRQRFVLHWESVRPVPRITVDYGDGRTLQGTITGNSIHYVLDTRGRLVDALPGLYGPGLFLKLLEEAEQNAQYLAPMDDPLYLSSLSNVHTAALLKREGEFSPIGGAKALLAMAPAASGEVPTALEAGRLAMNKSISELPLVEAISGPRFEKMDQHPIDGVALVEHHPTDWTLAAPKLSPVEAVSRPGLGRTDRHSIDWAALVEHHRRDWTLSAASRRFMAKKHQQAGGDSNASMLEAFERVLGLDTVRNEYLLHTVLHGWLSDPLETVPDLALFNDRVYADLFLTPSSDPWLGLRSPETYLALAPTPVNTSTD